MFREWKLPRQGCAFSFLLVRVYDVVSNGHGADIRMKCAHEHADGRQYIRALCMGVY